MKNLRIGQEIIYASLLIMLALTLRIFLAASSWPLPNSDEGTIGVMALHIQQGERPIFYYGQHYMGTLEAYLAALLFPLFGQTLFSLRLALVLLFAGFLIAMYLLTRLLYSKHFALFVLFLLSLGSNAVLSRQLSAIGGYVETILFSALAFLLVSWLVLSPPQKTMRNRLQRLVAYSAWGLVIGLGLWSDLLILPVVICSALFLFLWNWRKLLKGYVVPLLLFLVLGSFPLLYYNLHALPGTDSWTILMQQQGHVDNSLKVFIAQMKATLGYSIPTITGSPLCHHSEFQFLYYLGFQESHPMDASCSFRGNIWSGTYLALFLLASVMIILSLLTRTRSRRDWRIEEQQYCRRNTMRLCIVLSTLLTIALYTHSEAPLNWPSVYSRYLICIWISTPLVLWPLWQGVVWVSKVATRRSHSPFLLLRRAFCLSLLLCLCAALLYGTYITLNEAPLAIAANQREHHVIDTLLKNKITHVYSGYWTCNRIAFESQERIICGVLRTDLTSPGLNRYEKYYTIVKQDPQSSYIFERNTNFVYSQASDLKIIEQKLALTGKKYRQIFIENYVIYQPLS